MSLTVSALTRHSCGDQIKVNFTAAITTGSETITASTLGLSVIEDGQATDSVGYAYDITPAAGGATATLTVYYCTSATTSPLTALAGGASNVSPKIVVYGR